MIYLFLAPGFEEVEALAPLDLLRRAGRNVTTVAITTPAGIPATERAVTGSHRITVMADMSEADFTHYMETAGGDPAAMPIRAVILPGGMPGTKHLDASPLVDAALRLAADQNACLAAICAAPLVLGKRGYLKGRRATCFPGFEGDLLGATTGGKVIRDGGDGDYVTVTAAGMGVAREFGLELVSLLVSPDKAGELCAAIQAI